MLTPGHILFDLIYNPDKTTFLRAGEKKGCQIQNGLRMLELQAEKSWEIWSGSYAAAFPGPFLLVLRPEAIA
jgi:shikimate dehydrogenase